VVAMLNEYMTEMVKIIDKHHGVVDKYVGDAIMALWGAPQGSPDDAYNAVRAALEMRKVMIAFNSRRRMKNLAGLKIGIGLHTGEVVAGNIGSDQRMEYTVIGDNVNQASRIESANKDVDSDILISDTTYNLVKGRGVVAGPPLSIKVKGKSSSLIVHQLIGHEEGGRLISELESSEQNRIRAQTSLPNSQHTSVETATSLVQHPTQMFAMTTVGEFQAPTVAAPLWFLVRNVQTGVVEGPLTQEQLQAATYQPGFNFGAAYVFQHGDREMVPIAQRAEFSRRRAPPGPQDLSHLPPPMPEVIATAKPDEWYVSSPSGATLGPYHLDQLQHFVNSGTVLRTALVWKTGLPQWIHLYEVPGFDARAPSSVPTPDGATATQVTVIAPPLPVPRKVS
jgi:class 3 adenylate cyclase